MHARGDSVSEIARTLSIDRKTVYRYIEKDDFSPEPPTKTPGPSKLDPYKPIIDGWLEADRGAFHKQRHTISRIQARLEQEHGFICGHTIIQSYVRSARTKQHDEGRLDQVWTPGSAQIDFGEADCEIDGELIRCHYLVVSFPHSNMGYLQVFRSECAECVCEGLSAIFYHIGGVPHTLVFDNATGVGKKIKREVIETKLFSSFRAHHLFEVRFCNTASGWEKGNVERKVALLRNELLVPVSKFSDIEVFNESLLVQCVFQERRIHYSKDKPIGTLFAEDAKTLFSLPPKPFDVVRYETYTSDGWGNVCVDGRHTYSTTPDNARTATIAAIRAHTVGFLTTEGQELSVHTRMFGNTKTKSVNPAQSIRLLSKRPGGWKNSRLRLALPSAVITYLDAYTHAELRRDLSLLADACEKNGYDTAMEALSIIIEHAKGAPSFFEVGVLAARIANFGIDTPPDTGADLNLYDEAFLGGGVK